MVENFNKRGLFLENLKGVWIYLENEGYKSNEFAKGYGYN